MQPITICFLYCWAAIAHGGRLYIALEADRPSLRVQLSDTATLECCYNVTGSVECSWVACFSMGNCTVEQKAVEHSDHRVTVGVKKSSSHGLCRVLTLREVRLNDTGLYQCLLQHKDLRTSVYSHGTFLQVYKPMVKNLNISESVKNSILTAEGVLLLLCVVLPGSMLLCKSRKLKKREKRRVKEEEENIYEGLNLEDCTSAYHQIQRSQVEENYQDVGNMVEEEEDIQLEKP